MIAFELEAVYGGWEQADFGPSDQIDYVVETDAGPAENYDSLHTLLKLYDLARIEQSRHPRFLGYSVHETGPDGEIEVEIHGRRATTTYEELRAEMEPFLASVFRALDEETVGDGREEHIASIVENEEVLVDLRELYDRLVGE
jgi:hypothetical protein